MRKWMAILLCLAQLAGLCGCQAVTDALAAVADLRRSESVLSAVMPEMSAVMTPPPTAAPQPTPQPTPTLPQANSELVPAYRRYDVEDFESACDRLIDCTEPEEAVALYDRLYQRLLEISAEEPTLEDINRIYSEVCVEFGQYDEVYDDGWWMFVSHNYDSPLYYISYAASGLAALQIWSLSREDYAAAVDTWRSVVRAGAYDRNYAALLSECGLKSFADENAVEEVCAPVLDYLAENG